MHVRGSEAEAGDRQPQGVVAAQHHPSGPPAALYTDDDGEVFETVKEEEVVHRRRKATTTTKNIERRTLRDVLLEDGKVVGDTGPTVTEDVTEDTQVKETFADENLKPEGQPDDAVAALPPGEGWVAVPGSLITSEKVERYVNSHQEQENTKETEQVAHYGDVTNEEVEKHKGSVGSLALAAQQRKAAAGKEVALSEPRLVNESNREWGVVDTEDVKETSRIKDGHVVTETHRTTQQEQFDHGSAPDSGSSISDGSVHEEGHKAQHHLVHTKDEDILEYYAVPKGGTLAQGVKLGEGMHVVSEDVQEDREGDELETVGAGLLRQRVGGPPPRQDALTKRPLDYIKEEKQRQDETTRWLEHHFGSESGGSDPPPVDRTAGGNRITITMSPHPASPPPTPPPQGNLRRWGPLSSTPTNNNNSGSTNRINSSSNMYTNNSTNLYNTTSTPVPPPITSKSAAAFTAPPPPPMPHQISEARARLRSTGRTLDDLDSGRDQYTGRVRQDSYNYSQGSGEPFTPPLSPTSPTSFSSNYPSNGRLPQAPTVNGTSSYLNMSNVGRSQSFHTSNIERNDSGSGHHNYNAETWQPRAMSPQPAAPPRQVKNRPLSGQFSTLQNPKKKSDRSAKLYDDQWSNKREEGLDESWKQFTSYRNSDDKYQERSKKSSKYAREKENDRPYSSLENGYGDRSNMYNSHGSTQFSAKMAGKYSTPPSTSRGTEMFTQTGEAPVPPPRTKRRQRPQTTYFFGQAPSASASSGKQRPASIYANMPFNSNSAKDDYENRYNSKLHKQSATHINKSTSFTNGRHYNDNQYNDNYSSRNQSRSRLDPHNDKSKNDNYDASRENIEMNRRNENYNNRPDSRYSNGRDYSNERYDSGYGDRPESLSRQHDQHTRTEERSGRRSADGRRYEEKSSRRTSEEKKRNNRKGNKEERSEKRGSPIVERRYKTTKTITPVFVMETKQPKQYRSMDILNAPPEKSSAWTHTLESRKKVSDDNMRNSSTLPRKVHHTKFSMPSKTYIYGTDNDRSDKVRRYASSGSMLNVASASSGSMLNVASAQNDYEAPTSNIGYRQPRMANGTSPIITNNTNSVNNSNSAHVLRSQSLNVRPVTNLSSLRSPNLIASIARSNSTRRPETQSSEDLLSKDLYEREDLGSDHRKRCATLTQPIDGKSDEQKSRFMEGLLNTAPELFHFIHGEEGQDTVDSRNTTDTPPRLVRPPDASSPSPGLANAPKVFTFGREGGSTLRRGSSGSGNELNTSITNINKASRTTNSIGRNSSGYDSGSYSNNSLNRNGSSNLIDSNNRRQSTFNMRTKGGSLLYSPSFRERSQQMQQEKLQMQQDAEMAGKRAGLSTGLPRDNAPILIQVRDWNAR